IKTLFSGFEEELTQHGIGSISEMYDGDPPHKAAGSISHSVSVAELIRLSVLIEQFNKQVI
ncbi:MAG TPA: amylo-alpha-1,6-glucosidase, partial [Bacteroidales bacterium]|nr:amylo-alpha-1,6-glucosidase [Bacteroidales bacterium]